MLLYKTTSGLAISAQLGSSLTPLTGFELDDLFTGQLSPRELARWLVSEISSPEHGSSIKNLLPPIGAQEVWAAGVTYLRSCNARMDESSTSGGSDFYDKIYKARRPELFFKATPHRVVGHDQTMKLRKDSHWNVPEPELTLAFTNRGDLLGYTIGNDLSSRDIEGENPLYLPQAKVFETCAALGPGLLLADSYPPPETSIHLAIRRGGADVFIGETRIANMKQTFENLQEHLFRHDSFPKGCYLMTGTGIVPPNDFTLQPADKVSITIDNVGTLTNVMS